MSGHSKWATIHRQKGINDAKKGAVFTKLSQAITVAVRAGNGISDPDMNFKLRLAIEKARQFNMPKDNINRAIEKGTGGGEGTNFSEPIFEGFLPGGVAVLVEALTDNKLRTAQQIRDIVDKNGGNMVGQGAVSYLFSQVGELRISTSQLTDDDELRIIDLGIIDLEKEDDGWMVYCDKEKLSEIRVNLEKMGFVVTGMEISMKPAVLVTVDSGEVRQKIESILNKLDDLDDVSYVWTNYA
jgi:YebC/PmpR family DNA-binding regulatory protein